MFYKKIDITTYPSTMAEWPCHKKSDPAKEFTVRQSNAGHIRSARYLLREFTGLEKSTFPIPWCLTFILAR